MLNGFALDSSGLEEEVIKYLCDGRDYERWRSALQNGEAMPGIYTLFQQDGFDV